MIYAQAALIRRDPEALYQLGKYHRDGTPARAADVTKARECFEAAAAIGGFSVCNFNPARGKAPEGGAVDVTMTADGLSAAIALAVSVPSALTIQVDDDELTALGELCAIASQTTSTCEPNWT